MVKDPYLTRTGGSFADATSFLVSVKFLNDICPNEIEYSRFILHWNGIAERQSAFIIFSGVVY
jgi:hypothetical protein